MPAVGGCLALAACAGAWCVRSYRITTSPISPKTRRGLLALRLAAIALLTLWILQPTSHRTWDEDVRGVVLIGVDTSSSMQRPDAGPDRLARIQATRNALQAAQRPLDDLAGQADIQFFTFNENVVASGQGAAAWTALLSDADGSATAIGQATLQAIQTQRASGANLQAVVLMTDGCDNADAPTSPDDLARRLANRNLPVHTVRAGSEDVAGDLQALSVTALGAPATVSAFSRMTLEPTVETIGLANRTIRVTCRFGETELEPQTFTPTDTKDTRRLRFEHIPLDAGFHRLSVTAEVVDNAPPTLAGQPSRDQLVQVVDRDIRVLYIEGKFRYETKFINAAIGTFDRVSLHRHVLLQPMRQTAALGEDLDSWMRYHAILLGDVGPEQFTPQQLLNLRTLVETYGKGVAMMGGHRSFGAGGWAETPLADVLPVEIRGGDGQIDEPVSPAPTPAGRDTALMQIGPPEAPLAPWDAFDALPGASDIGTPKPTAEVLAEAGDRPMIVAGQVGKGRTLAIAFDTTWRWVLSPKDTADAQKRFWRQVVMYLADPRGHVWIHASRGTYDLRSLTNGSQELLVSAGLSDSRGEPVTDISPTITLTTPDGQTTPVALPRDGQGFKGTLPPPTQPGLYRLEMAATIEGQSLTGEYQFDVKRRNLEAAAVLANDKLLRRLAKATDGQAVGLEDLPRLVEAIAANAQPKPVTVHEARDLLAPLRWPMVLAVLGLLCAEWALRKKRNLV